MSDPERMSEEELAARLAFTEKGKDGMAVTINETHQVCLVFGFGMSVGLEPDEARKVARALFEAASESDRRRSN